MRILLTFVVALGISLALAGQEGHGKITRKTLSVQDVVEKLEGKDAKVTMLEVTLDPGQAGAPHRHHGPVYGYILEGEYEWAINDQPARKLKVGDTFYEPTMSLHRVSRNPSDKNKTRVLAILVHPRDAKEISIPEPAKK
jgi:quercetin dioxygenase-like cupin family protein